MAPLAGYRSWLAPRLQIRASSWMLMSGSVGLVAATLPVQWALPFVGWRPLFLVLAVLFVVTIAGTAWLLPAWHASTDADANTGAHAGSDARANSGARSGPGDCAFIRRLRSRALDEPGQRDGVGQQPDEDRRLRRLR